MRARDSLRERKRDQTGKKKITGAKRGTSSPSCASHPSFGGKNASINYLNKNGISETDFWRLNVACFNHADTIFKSKFDFR